MRTITVSQTGVGKSAPIPLDYKITPFQVSLATQLNGASTYNIEYTLDDIRAPGYNPNTGNWYAVNTLSGVSAAGQGQLVGPVTAVRINQTASGGTTTLQVLQAGVIG